jgi:anthranilate synthase component 2
MTARLLVIDNYDSFTYNLVQMFGRYDLEIDVFRSDRISVSQAESFCPDYLLISPGPKDPAHAGVSMDLIKAFYEQIPVLGVCLGMQCMNEAFGGQTVRAPVPMHGKVSSVHHSEGGIFRSLPSPFSAARYHSLAVKPAEDSPLEITALSEDKVIMGLSHRQYPLHGVQFHPESFLTESGYVMAENFLQLGPLKKPVRYE